MVVIAGTLSMKAEAAVIIVEKNAAYRHANKVCFFIYFNSLMEIRRQLQMIKQLPELFSQNTIVQHKEAQSAVFPGVRRDQDRER